MNVVMAKTETGRAMSDAFAIARDRLAGTGKVADLRRQAFDAYDRAGLPHRRIEDWKYTDLRALMREVLPLAPAPDAPALVRAASALKLHAIAGARRLVLVDGVFAPKLSDTRQHRKGPCHPHAARSAGSRRRCTQAQLFAPDNSNPMVALNSAMMTDGLVIDVADGAVLTQPLHIVHIASGGTPAAMFTRSLLRLGKDAGATLVESYIARRWRQGLSGARFPDCLDRQQFATRPCSAGRGRPRRLQHFFRRRDAGRARAFQHVWHDLGRQCQPLSGHHRLCRRGFEGRDQRRQSAQRPPARRHHAVPRPRGAELRQP